VAESDDSNTVWNPSFRSIADNRELAIERVERFIFDVMKMIRNRVPGRVEDWRRCSVGSA